MTFNTESRIPSQTPTKFLLISLASIDTRSKEAVATEAQSSSVH